MNYYAIINPDTGLVLRTMKCTEKYFEIDGPLPEGKNHVLRDGELVEAPVINISLGFCATPEKMAPDELGELELLESSKVDNKALDIRNIMPDPYAEIDPKHGPIVGLPFELLFDIPDEWKDHRTGALLLQVDDARHPFKVVPGVPIAMPAGRHVLQIIGPGAWRSNKLTVDVAEAPDMESK